MKIIQNLPDGKLSKKCTEEEITNIVIPLMEEMQKLCHEPLGEHKNGALAIAHCQVEDKEPLRFFVLASGDAIVNPHISDFLGKKFRNTEGCMSFSEKKALRSVERYKNIVCSFTQVTPDKQVVEQKKVKLSGQLAMIFQHEVDHMNGKNLW